MPRDILHTQRPRTRDVVLHVSSTLQEESCSPPARPPASLRGSALEEEGKERNRGRSRNNSPPVSLPPP